MDEDPQPCLDLVELADAKEATKAELRGPLVELNEAAPYKSLEP